MTWTKDLINSLDVFNVSTNLNLTNQHFVNMTKKMQTDLNMTNQHFVNMTKKMQTDLDLTNQHLVNITKKMQTDLVKLRILPNVTLPEMQEVIGSLDFLNVSQLNIFNVTNLDIFNVTNLDIFNVTNLDIFNVTNLDIFNLTQFNIINVTRQKVSDFEQQFNQNPLVAHLKTLSQNQNSTKSNVTNYLKDSEEEIDDQSLQGLTYNKFLIWDCS